MKGKLEEMTIFYEKDAEKYKADIEQALDSSWNDDRCYNAFYECIEGIDRLDVYVALFRNEIIDYMEEQERIVSFYEQLKKVQKESEENFTLRIVITYFPQNYSNVIKKQYESNEIMNYNHIITTRADKLIANGEVYAQFEYDEDVSFDEEQCLDEVVADKEGCFAKPYKLQYWR